ncbi:hypothetical protein SARC_01377 [Sphaeroforma arctica JP610]|uniref:Uncharacterized protein n=1 Tax=Sphaeroforma arctica JP610 TaxID=667725 RepID=A0A0L0GBS4_9EUKA|nr:hypothetical protein SARC_01377 [Sphaeroforma arctica JP610]KNC86467.1 hypothetical protein SARC_01377 [Sphaeroforma arctica JP610]|eukprot:XP_014160369.1 hypothetical protein SARC_01377 [Sphaeroforma arctica JP610]
MRPHSQPLLPPGVDSNDYIPNEHATTPEPYVQATPHTAYGTGPYKSGSYVSNDAIGMTTHVRPQGQPFSHIQQNTSVNIVASTLSVSASNINPVRTVVPAQPMNAGTSIAEAQQMRRLRVREFMNKNKVHKPVSVGWSVHDLI